MSFRKHHNPEVRERISYLEKWEELLSYRTDLKIALGCWGSSKELSAVQARVMAQVYGMQWAYTSQVPSDYLFRWLLAHLGNTKYDFRVRKSHYQWPDIIGRYFLGNGQYAEIAVLEKILLTILRSRKPTPISDIFMADRMADAHMKTDWIMHRDMPQGRLQLWVQVSVWNHVIGKTKDILTRPTHDRVWFESKHSPIVSQFLRHGTAVMTFPHFTTSMSQIHGRRELLLDGKRTYQSRLVKENNPAFEHYGRWIMEIIEALDDGIKRRLIDAFPHTVKDLHYDYVTRDGHKIQITNKKIGQDPVVVLEFFREKSPKSSSRPIIFCLPLSGDLLDIYRDKLGARAY